MDAKHRIVQLLGITGLVSGCLFFFLMLRGLILGRVADAWGVMHFTFALAFATYLLSVGIRGMRWARGQGTARSARVKWGRVLLGSLLIFIQVENHFHPAANLLRPSNGTEAAAMNATAIVLAFLGAWLVVSGVIARFKRQVRDEESSKVVP